MFTSEELRALVASTALENPRHLPRFAKREDGEYVTFVERLAELRRSRDDAPNELRLAFGLHVGATIGSAAVAALSRMGLNDPAALEARINADRVALAARLEEVGRAS